MWCRKIGSVSMISAPWIGTRGLPSLLIVFLQPLHLLAKLDVAVPWVLLKAVPLAREHQKRVWNAERLQCPLHCLPFEVADANIGSSLYQMSRRFHLVEMEEGGLFLVDRWILPWAPTQIPGIVPRL